MRKSSICPAGRRSFGTREDAQRISYPEGIVVCGLDRGQIGVCLRILVRRQVQERKVAKLLEILSEDRRSTKVRKFSQVSFAQVTRAEIFTSIVCPSHAGRNFYKCRLPKGQGQGSIITQPFLHVRSTIT